MADAAGYILDADGAERVTETVRRVLGTPLGRGPTYPTTAMDRSDVLRAVVIKTDPPEDGRYRATLQWRDDATTPGVWNDFDPSIECWAIGYNDEALEAGKRYPGRLVGFEPVTNLGVFAAGAAAGAAGGGGPRVGRVLLARVTPQGMPGENATAIQWQSGMYDIGGYGTGLTIPTGLGGLYHVNLSLRLSGLTGSQERFVYVASGINDPYVERAPLHLQFMEQFPNPPNRDTMLVYLSGIRSFEPEQQVSATVWVRFGGCAVDFATIVLERIAI